VISSEAIVLYGKGGVDIGEYVSIATEVTIVAASHAMALIIVWSTCRDPASSPKQESDF